MRIALAALLWLMLVGGLFAFLAATSPPKPASAPAPTRAAGLYTLELTCTFALEPDPFAMEPGGEPLVILLKGRPLAREMGPPKPGAPFRLNANWLEAGVNEFFLWAAVPLAESDRAHAVRLVLKKDEGVVAESTFWSEPGGPLAGVLTVELPGAEEGRP